MDPYSGGMAWRAPPARPMGYESDERFVRRTGEEQRSSIPPPITIRSSGNGGSGIGSKAKGVVKLAAGVMIALLLGWAAYRAGRRSLEPEKGHVVLLTVDPRKPTRWYNPGSAIKKVDVVVMTNDDDKAKVPVKLTVGSKSVSTTVATRKEAEKANKASKSKNNKKLLKKKKKSEKEEAEEDDEVSTSDEDEESKEKEDGDEEEEEATEGTTAKKSR